MVDQPSHPSLGQMGPISPAEFQKRQTSALLVFELVSPVVIQSVGEGCVYKCRGPGGGECCREHKAQGSPAFPFSPLAALPSPHPLLGPFGGPSQTTGSFTAQIKSFLSVAATALHGPHLFRKGARKRPFDVLGQENREFTANQGMYVLGAGEMERE